MLDSRSLAGLALPLLASLSFGCAQFDTGSVARLRAAELLDCPEDDVSMEQVGAYRYLGEGCGGRVRVACTSAALEPRCFREGGTAGGDALDDEASDEPLDDEPLDDEASDDEASDDRGEVADAPAPELEAQIRAGLDARRDDVLACAGRERIALRVAYAPDGSVGITVQGDLAGTAEERCVQDALDGVRVAATGQAGVVVHLVR